MLAVVGDRFFTRQHLADNRNIFPGTRQRLKNGAPYQPSTTWGPETPKPNIMRPLDKWSMVSAAIATAACASGYLTDAGAKANSAGLCADPSRGVSASLP